jgi:L-ascorbate metabolism protein UlaG (beta-lactamase superfamily)
MTPEEAVRAHEILGAKTSIAIHHGTFQPQMTASTLHRNSLWLVGETIRF